MFDSAIYLFCDGVGGGAVAEPKLPRFRKPKYVVWNSINMDIDIPVIVVLVMTKYDTDIY